MATTITVTQLYQILEPKVGKKEAEALTTYIDEKISETSEGVATKEFVRAEIQQSKADMIKWFVGLFVALALMIIGLYFKK
jgi:hypothetical protein